jgi:hypothetical protein
VTAETFEPITPTETSQTQLTEIELVEEQETDVETQKHLSFDPYSDKTPKAILERKYLILNVILDDTTPTVFYPLLQLKAKPGPTHAFKGFKYLRADMELQILITTTRSTYGTLLVSTVPYQDPALPLGFASVTQQIQANGHFLDLSRQEALSLTIPYLDRTRMWAIEDLDTIRQYPVRVTPLFINTTTADSPVSTKM